MKLRNCDSNTYAALLGIAATLGITLTTYGGWTGSMTGTGSGWASANITSSTLVSASARTNMLSPGAAMPRPATNVTFYAATNSSPAGSSVNTYAKIKGFPGYVWKAYTTGVNGDKTDNDEIDKRVVIKPALCTELTMESEQGPYNPQTKSGTLIVKTKGTAGTGLLLRGFEVDDATNIPLDDPNTPEDESLEYVKNNGALKFENLVIGPFDYGFDNNCPLIIHFTLEEGNLDNFVFTTDGTAKSEPMVVSCPPSQTVECGSGFVYPAVAVNTCREVTAVYAPDESELEVGENTVTVTVTDDQGDSASCSFIVTVLDTTAPTAPTLAAVNAACASSVTLTPPTANDCSGTITGTTATLFPITSVGTTLVTWTFTDPSGNSSTANQNVTIAPYTLDGFYSPINALGGACDATARNVRLGSVIPVKFNFKCGSGQFITSGPAPVVKIQSWSNCGLVGEPVSIPAEYQNDWHINWDTSKAIKGVYKIIAVLPDGSRPYVFVNLR